MMYATKLKKLLRGTDLSVEDLLLLESFQINYLPDRVPQKEFAALLRAYPFVQRFLISKSPAIENFIIAILKEYKTINNKETIEKYCDELVWEIADLIIYNKHPELYDEKVNFAWEIDEIINTEKLQGRIVADVGAGSGRLSFLLSEHAKTVYAIEPIGSFRNYIREKATRKKCKNLCVIDGFLDNIPLPDDSVDILFTSNAIGWNLEKELFEIERIVKPGGQAIHLMKANDEKTENAFHERLVSYKWKYEFHQCLAAEGIKLKYVKKIETSSH